MAMTTRYYGLKKSVYIITKTTPVGGKEISNSTAKKSGKKVSEDLITSYFPQYGSETKTSGVGS
jgi:hypothetical protein